MYVTPLTAAERERAKKDARSDDPGAFALSAADQAKRKDSNGRPLFNARRHAAILKNEVRDSDLAEVDAVAVLGADEEEDDLRS